MSIGNRMRGLGESVYYLDDLKPKMDELMGDVSYELNHEVGKRKLLVRLDGFGEEYKPQIETLMDEELPVGYRMEYDPFPLDFIRLDFLEGAGYNSTYIDTGIIKTDAFNASLTWSQNTNRRATGWGYAYQQDSISYSSHVQISNNSAKFGNYMVYCYRGYTIYPFPPYEGYTPLDKHTMVCNTGRKEMTIDGVTYKTGYSGANRDISNPQKRSIYLFGVNGWLVEPFLKIYAYSTWDDGKEKDIDFIPAIDSAGIPCMFDLVTKQPFYNQGTGQFIAGLTMKQALNLAKLPTPSGNNKLTISLPKEATLVQHNQRVNAVLETVAEKGWNIPVQYRDEFDDESILNKYAECVTIADIVRVNPEFTEAEPSPYGDYDYYFTKDLTTDGDFPYNLPKFNSNQHWVNGGFFKHVFVDKFIIKLPALVNATATCCRCMSKEIVFDAPNATNMMYVFSDCANLEKATFTSSPTNIERICMSYGSMVLREIYGDFTKVTSANQAFYNCQLNKETVLRICSELPTVSNKPITLGIHTDYKTDEEVAEGISNLESKGWTVTVQWKGTPTAQSASTFGLRKPPIYAKIDTMEYPDGTVEKFLDWGHYVTKWEENSYQEFASIEEAEEYFNIKKEITE